MLYYSFDTNFEPHVIGVKDGMAQVNIRPEGYRTPGLYKEMENFLAPGTYWPRPDHTPPHPFTIEYAQLRLKAKLTDFLAFSPFLMACPFMLSARAKAVFERHCLPPSFFFDAFIYDQNGLVTGDYSLFYSPMLGYEAIDFAQSRFRINMSLPATPVWRHHTFPDVAAYLAFCDASRKPVQVEALVMSEHFNANVDFFKCRLGLLFMSERLRKAVEAGGLSNVIFPAKTGSLAFAD